MKKSKHTESEMVQAVKQLESGINADVVSREHDIVMKWGPYNFPYLLVDGYRYWTMGSPYEETIILNRAKGEETQPL